jgi:hypothetical protein
MKNTWAAIGKSQPNFEMRQLEHMGFNPIHEERVAKALEVKKPKLNKLSSPKSSDTGNPWMGVK